MELRQLRQFVTIARTGSFVAAARELGIAQPPLTVSVRKLEDQLGVRLFERHARGATLTAAGLALLKLASELLARADDLERMAQEIGSGQRGRLRIGFVGSASYLLLPQLLRRFRALHPDVELVVTETTSRHALRQLEEDQLDVGLVRLPVMHQTDVRIVRTITEPMILMVPLDHPLAGQREAALETLGAEGVIQYDLEAVPNMRAIVSQAFARAGYVPRIVHEASQIHALMALVESGLGIALLPACVRRANPERGWLLDLTAGGNPIETTLGIAVSRHVSRPVVGHFCEMLSDPKELAS